MNKIQNGEIDLADVKKHSSKEQKKHFVQY